MNLEDVKIYILKKKLNVISNKREVVDERAYLYAYLYHFLKLDNLSEIGRMFAPTNEFGNHIYDDEGKIKGAKDHATVRHHLIKSHELQFNKEFIENTKELHKQIPIIIPEYRNKIRNITKIPNVKKKGKEYEITIKVTRAEFYEYARKQDPEVVLDFMFRHMLDAAPRLNKTRNPYRKSN